MEKQRTTELSSFCLCDQQTTSIHIIRWWSWEWWRHRFYPGSTMALGFLLLWVPRCPKQIITVELCNQHRPWFCKKGASGDALPPVDDSHLVAWIWRDQPHGRMYSQVCQSRWKHNWWLVSKKNPLIFFWQRIHMDVFCKKKSRH